MGLWSHVRMVLWSFFGIRRRAAAGDEIAHARPGVLVAVGIALAAMFGLGVWGAAHLAVRSLG